MPNDGKFILDGKRVKFSDYGGSSKEVLTAPSLLHRLDTIEADVTELDNGYDSIEAEVSVLQAVGTAGRLDFIESEIGIMFKIVAENHLALMKIEKRIAIMQEKIDGID